LFYNCVYIYIETATRELQQFVYTINNNNTKSTPTYFYYDKLTILMYADGRINDDDCNELNRIRIIRRAETRRRHFLYIIHLFL